MTIQFTRRFDKMYARLPIKIQRHFEERLSSFLRDPHAAILANHPLHGEYRTHRSINITGDYRAVYYDMTNNHVIFVAIGTHSQLYR